MGNGIESLDPESRKILEQAMSMDSSMRAMGINQVREAEQRQLAEDMERKNAEARRRRGAAIAGENPDAAPQVQRQTPIRRRKGMNRQVSPVQQEPPEHIAPVSQVPTGDAPSESAVDAGTMRRAFARLSGNTDTAEPVSPPVQPVQEPVQVPDRAKESPAQDADVPKEPRVRLQEFNDRPPDVDPARDDFNVFTPVTRLPSKGLFYPGQVYGQSLKLIDNYYLDDVVDGTSTAREAIDAILGRRIRGVDPLDILTIDEPYLLHWLRASSFPKHGMRHPGYVCPHCKFDTDTDNVYRDFRIGFGNLKFTLTKDIDELYSLHRENGYHAGFLDDGRECHVYVHRLRHARELNGFLDEWEQKNGISAPKAIRKAAGVATVVEIEGCEGIWEKFGYISELPDVQKETFENLVVEGTVACNLSAVIKCGRCGGVVETPYPFRVPWFVSGL
jgi:hypothetical protein